MPGALFNDKLRPAIVELGRVLDVNVANYSLTVCPLIANRPMSGVSFATPYQHFENGEGIYFMPEVGSLVWICRPSEGGSPVVLGWASGLNKTDHRTNKRDLNPGDIYLGTRDENGIFLRRGGVIQIAATPLAQRIYLPVNNTIKDFCEQYSLNTVAGDLEWTVGGVETSSDGDRPCALTIKARSKAKDAKPIAQLKIGSHDDSTVLSLIIKASGEDGAADQVSLLLDKDGNVKWTVKKDVSWDIDGKFTVSAKDDISLTSKGKVTLEATGAAKLKGGSEVKVEADGSATVKGATVTLDGSASISLGNGATDGVLKGAALFAWLASHTHLIIAPIPGTPTSPATAGTGGSPPGSGISTTVMAK